VDCAQPTKRGCGGWEKKEPWRQKKRLLQKKKRGKPRGGGGGGFKMLGSGTTDKKRGFRGKGADGGGEKGPGSANSCTWGNSFSQHKRERVLREEKKETDPHQLLKKGVNWWFMPWKKKKAKIKREAGRPNKKLFGGWWAIRDQQNNKRGGRGGEKKGGLPYLTHHQGKRGKFPLPRHFPVGEGGGKQQTGYRGVMNQ